MTWGAPKLLLLLFLLPFLGIFFAWALKKRARDIELLVGPQRETLVKGGNLKVWVWRVVSWVIVAGCLIVALAQPRWGYEWEDVERKGVDIVIALDLSNSMLARDISPNRLERAKREVKDLLPLLKGDRIGLVAFAGSAFMQCPLTLDYATVRMFLDELDTDFLPTQGTAIAAAIEVAGQAFKKSAKNSRALILITDGEEQEGDPVAKARAAASEGVRIFPIGVGSVEGAPIPEPGGGFKKDRSGKVILSRLGETQLQEIASVTNGSYVRSVSGDMDLEKIYGDLRGELEDQKFRGGRRKRYLERFQWPLALGLILLLLEMWQFKGLRRKTALTLLLLSFGSPAFSDPETHYKKGEFEKARDELIQRQVESPEDSKVAYNLGNTLYRLGDYANAEKQFALSSKDPKLAQQSLYNQGNALFQQNKLKEAITQYESALKLSPQDEEAKFNLELAKKRLEQQQQQKQNQKSDDKDKKDSEKKEQDQKQDSSENSQQDSQKPQESDKDQKPGEKSDKQENPKDNPEEKGEEEKKEPQSSEDKQEKPSEQSASEGKEEKSGNMSEEEAKQWLSTLKEDRRKYIQKQNQQSRQSERDW